MTRRLLIAAALAVLSLPASASDCVFDGACGPRPALTLAGASHIEEPEMSRWDGAKKGASEGAHFGFFGVLYPAVSLVSEGFGRRMNRADGGGTAAYYGGFALAAILYIPALVVGGLGALFGGAAGAVTPESAADWDAERTLFD